MPREGHGSRNTTVLGGAADAVVMPREGHGSRNLPQHHEQERQKLVLVYK